ncbi:MAG: hypothetical protein NZ890_16885 [Myxococcota bacterium]|nr:hypothetical protein [Myxococcota bacterium]
MRENAAVQSAIATLLLVAVMGAVACKTADPCPQGQTECNGSCVQTASNPDHCGGCGIACSELQVCSLGQCADNCAGGLALCGRQCVDVASDTMNCGGCGRRCAEGAVCEQGRCMGGMPACGDRLAIEVGGTLDLDLQVVEVSGTLTKNGAAVPAGRNRGTLAFVSRRGGQVLMAPFPETGPAMYRGEVIVGTYDVYYQPPLQCFESDPLPCQRALLRSGVVIQQGGTLDLDAKVVRVSGRLTKNGAAVPSVGRERGRLVFALQGGGSRMMPPFGLTGEAQYEGEVFAGTYEVRYEPPAGCGGTGDALPCQQVVLRSGVVIQQGGTLDLDAKVVRVSGRLTKNGAILPSTGRERGWLVFQLQGGGGRRMPPFGPMGEAQYEGEVFAGTYEVRYEPPLGCGGMWDVMPCQVAVLRSGVVIQQGGTLDLDAKVVRVSGRLTKNGAAVPSGRRGRGWLLFNLEGGGGRRMPPFGPTGEARYEGEVFTGKYDVLYQPELDCQPGDSLPCQHHLIRGCLPSG